MAPAASCCGKPENCIRRTWPRLPMILGTRDSRLFSSGKNGEYTALRLWIKQTAVNASLEKAMKPGRSAMPGNTRLKKPQRPYALMAWQPVQSRLHMNRTECRPNRHKSRFLSF